MPRTSRVATVRPKSGWGLALLGAGLVLLLAVLGPFIANLRRKSVNPSNQISDEATIPAFSFPTLNITWDATTSDANQVELYQEVAQAIQAQVPLLYPRPVLERAAQIISKIHLVPLGGFHAESRTGAKSISTFDPETREREHWILLGVSRLYTRPEYAASLRAILRNEIQSALIGARHADQFTPEIFHQLFEKDLVHAPFLTAEGKRDTSLYKQAKAAISEVSENFNLILKMLNTPFEQLTVWERQTLHALVIYFDKNVHANTQVVTASEQEYARLQENGIIVQEGETIIQPRALVGRERTEVPLKVLASLPHPNGSVELLLTTTRNIKKYGDGLLSFLRTFSQRQAFWGKSRTEWPESYRRASPKRAAFEAFTSFDELEPNIKRMMMPKGCAYLTTYLNFSINYCDDPEGVRLEALPSLERLKK